jgi:hypothetical protein
MRFHSRSPRSASDGQKRTSGQWDGCAHGGESDEGACKQTRGARRRTSPVFQLSRAQAAAAAAAEGWETGMTRSCEPQGVRRTCTSEYGNDGRCP